MGVEVAKSKRSPDLAAVLRCRVIRPWRN